MHNNKAINKHTQEKNKREKVREKEDYECDVITRHRFAIKHAVPGSFLSSNQEIKSYHPMMGIQLNYKRRNGQFLCPNFIS